MSVMIFWPSNSDALHLMWCDGVGEIVHLKFGTHHFVGGGTGNISVSTEHRVAALEIPPNENTMEADCGQALDVKKKK